MITIPEMENLPDNCHKCPLSYWNDENWEYWCPWNNCNVDYYDEERMDSCPLAESEDKE